MSWRIERQPYRNSWQDPGPRSCDDRIRPVFDSYEEAHQALLGFFVRSKSNKYRIIDADGAVWSEGFRREYLAGTETRYPSLHGEWTFEYDPNHNERNGMDPCTQLEKPLNLKVADVVAKLEENLAKETAKREEAAAKEKAARLEFDQFVSDHQTEIVNYLRAQIWGGSWSQTLESATAYFESHDYKTPESKPGRLESDLEKFVRVLKMSTDETIEVKPTQPIFSLL